MIAAVELRTDPTAQCNFTPLLDRTRRRCARARRTRGVLQGGLQAGAPRLDPHEPGPVLRLAGHELGGATRRCRAVVGDCRLRGGPRRPVHGGAGDLSGVMRLESPSIKLPSGAVFSPR